MASNFERSNGGLSMLEKSLERRRVNKEHNSNFRAGHVPVNEDHLHKTGLRGRKRFFAYLILALVFVAALANITMTIMIMFVLDINWHGLQPMSFMRNGLLRFNDLVDIDSIYSVSGQVGSYEAQDFIISAMEGTSSVKLQNTAWPSGSSFEVKGDETVLVSSHGFEIFNSDTGKSIFKMPGKREKMSAPPGEYTTLQASSITAPMVKSDTGQDLMISADNTVTLQGNEGVMLNSKQINFKADIIEFRSQADLVFEGNSDHGIYINTTLLDKSTGSTANKQTSSTYKLCVCQVSGLLFRVPGGTPHPCANLNATQNPCL